MEKIAIEFTYQETIFRGFLQAVCGGGASVWHLMINGYYYGRLRTAKGVWVLDTNKKSMGMETIAEVLGSWVGAAIT